MEPRISSLRLSQISFGEGTAYSRQSQTMKITSRVFARTQCTACQGVPFGGEVLRSTLPQHSVGITLMEAHRFRVTNATVHIDVNDASQ